MPPPMRWARILVLLLVVPAVACGDERSTPSDWRATLALPDLTPEQFTTAYAGMLRDHLDGAAIAITGELELSVTAAGRDQHTVFLDNAWRECRDEPARRVELCMGRLAALRGLLSRAQDLPPALADVVTVVKDRKFVDDMNTLSAGRSDALPPLHAEPLVADLVVVYAMDTPTALQYLRTHEVQELGVAAEDLRARAVANLATRLPQPRVIGDGAVRALVLDGTFEACLLLVDDVWKSQQEHVRGDLVVAAPARDVLLVTGSESRAGLAQLAETAARMHADAVYPISKTLLVRTGGSWKEWRESPR